MNVRPRIAVFVDGTNVLHRLRAHKVKMTVELYHAIHYSIDPHAQLHRVTIYTTEPEWNRGTEEHGERLWKNCRRVFGDSVASTKGAKEKGVDALLVADLVYHAASKNMDFAVLVSQDTDFRFALKRVEDFGCRTGLIAFCDPANDRLRMDCDKYYELSKAHLVSTGWAKESE